MNIFIRSRKHPPLQIQTYIGPLSNYILSRKFHYERGHNKPQSAWRKQFKLLIQSKNQPQFSLKTQTSIAEAVIFSMEYAVPYHGSTLSVCPSKLFDSQKILHNRMG
jgi:hypothetical protein